MRAEQRDRDKSGNPRRRSSQNATTSLPAVPDERIDQIIFLVRGKRVILDADLARLYEVETRALIQAVKRNIERFPADFMFQLTLAEARRSRSQTVILNAQDAVATSSSRSQPVTMKRGANIKYLPYAFTEQGVAMLSSVLRSPRAVQVNIEIMRAFVRLRQMLQANDDLARQLTALEKKYDAQFGAVFDAIRQLMAPPKTKGRKPIGFEAREHTA
jgi:hypothetical protein